MYYQNLIIIHEWGKKLSKMKNSKSFLNTYSLCAGVFEIKSGQIPSAAKCNQFLTCEITLTTVAGECVTYGIRRSFQIGIPTVRM